MTKKQIKKQQQQKEEEDSSENEQSEEESSIDEESSLDGEELNDEFELGDDEEDSSSNDDDDDDDDDEDDETTKSNQKSNKKKNTDGSDSFSSAITNILSSKIKAHSQKDPILVRTRKKLVKEMVEEKLEVKAKKAIAAERKQKMDKARVRNVFPQIGNGEDEEEDIEKQQARLNQYLEQEKRLKKIGQRGVIKLFNAILAAQRSTSSTSTNSNPVNINDTTTTKKSFVNVVEKEAATNVSKEKFLDLIRSGDTL